jgi:hypothetical protein
MKESGRSIVVEMFDNINKNIELNDSKIQNKNNIDEAYICNYACSMLYVKGFLNKLNTIYWSHYIPKNLILNDIAYTVYLIIHYIIKYFVALSFKYIYKFQI